MASSLANLGLLQRQSSRSSQPPQSPVRSVSRTSSVPSPQIIGRRQKREPHPSQAFIKKTEDEKRLLTNDCHKKLRYDIVNLFAQETDTDLVIEFESQRKEVHCCIIKARCPRFADFLLSTIKCEDRLTNYGSKRIRCELESKDGSKYTKLISFLEAIYNDNDLSSLEQDILDSYALKSVMAEDLVKSQSTTEPSCESNENGDNLAHEEFSSEKGEESKEVDPAEASARTNRVSSAPTERTGKRKEDIMNRSADAADFDTDADCDVSDLEPCSEGNDRRGQVSSSSGTTSMMIRSNTFDLLSQIPLDEPTNSLITGKRNSLGNGATKEIKSSKSSDTNGYEVPVVSPDQCFQSTSKAKSSEKPAALSRTSAGSSRSARINMSRSLTSPMSSSMFQFFVGVEGVDDQNSATREREEAMTRSARPDSGFIFIDLNQVGSDECKERRAKPKSRSAFERTALEDRVVRGTTRSEDITLLPMSPIVRERRTISDRNGHGQISSSMHRSHHSDKMHESMHSTTESVESWDDSMSRNEVFVDSHIKSQALLEETSDPDKYYQMTEDILKQILSSSSKIGQDLLRMFLDEVDPDTIIVVGSRQIKAHRCILSARCEYFSAMFGSEWRENRDKVIRLRGFSYSAVHFSLCHIYSGCSTIPKFTAWCPETSSHDSKDLLIVNIREMVLITDLLIMDSLREIVSYELRLHLCHFFHKPCDQCSHGVLHCLSMIFNTSFKDLIDKCLHWSAKYFDTIWPTRTFASLDKHIMRAIYARLVMEIRPNNIIQIITNCERILASLPRVKWAEPTLALVAKLMEDACKYVSENCDAIVATKEFIELGRSKSWNVSSIEETFLAAINCFDPDTSCRTLHELNKIIDYAEEAKESGFGYGPYTENFMAFILKMRRYCERHMVQNAGSVVNCSSWSKLSQESRQKITDSAVIVLEFEKPIAKPPKLSSSAIRNRRESHRLKEENSRESPTTPSDFDLSHERQTTANGSEKSPSDKPPKGPEARLALFRKARAETYRDFCSPSKKDTDFWIPLSKNDEKPMRFAPERRSGRSLLSSRSCNSPTTQVAKVSPFNIKEDKRISSTSQEDENLVASTSSERARHSNGARHHTASGSSINDLVAQIDSETNLVTEKLAEAKKLERRLVRKISNGRSSSNSRPSTSKVEGACSHNSSSKDSKHPSHQSVRRKTQNQETRSSSNSNSESLFSHPPKSASSTKKPSHRHDLPSRPPFK